MRYTAVILRLIVLVLALQLSNGCNKRSTPSATNSPVGVAPTNTDDQSGFSGHPWPTVGQNNQRTSCSPLPGPNSPELKWSVQLTGDNGNYRYGLTRNALVAKGNIIYVQVAMKIINAVNADGQLLWAELSEATAEQPIVGIDGNLLGTGETVYSVESETGETSKYFDKGLTIPMLLDYNCRFDFPLQISEDKLLVQAKIKLESKLNRFDSLKYYALALNKDGREIWKTEVPDFTIFELSSGSSDQIFFPSGSELVAIGKNGDRLWTYKVQRGGTHKVVYGSEDCIVFYNLTWKLCHVLNRNGRLVWTEDFSPLKISHVSISNQGNLLIGLLEPRQPNGPHKIGRFLVSFDPQGHELWRKEFTIARGIYPIIDVNDNIYFCSEEGVYSLSSDGTEKWKFDLPDCTGQVVIGEDNKLFVLTKGGMLHCIGETE